MGLKCSEQGDKWQEMRTKREHMGPVSQTEDFGFSVIRWEPQKSCEQRRDLAPLELLG